MAEYIERKAAFREAKRFLACHIDGVVRNHAQLAYETCNPTEFARGYEQGAMDCVNAALATPAADVAPVVHGRWVHEGQLIKHGVDWYRCSQCGDRNGTKFMNYCPNCGAYMRGGNDE